jgi:hypothetical protein
LRMMIAFPRVSPPTKSTAEAVDRENSYM